MKLLSTKHGDIILDDEDYERITSLKGACIYLKGTKLYLKKRGFIHCSLANFIKDRKGVIYNYKDGNMLNNRKENLVIKGYHDKGNEIKGVREARGVFEARCTKDRKMLHKGVYKDKVTAAIAYNKALDILYGIDGPERNIVNINKELYNKIYNDVSVSTVNMGTKQGANCKLRNRSSEFTGVSYENGKNKWRVALSYNDKYIFVGRFDSEIEAAQAYNETVLYLYGEECRLNPVPKPLHSIVDLDKIKAKLEKKGIKL